MKKYFVRLVFFCVISLCTACTTAPVFNILQSGFSAPKGRSNQDVQQAIMKGAEHAGWTATVKSPTEILAAYTSPIKQGQGARVSITYDLDSYRIYYQSSLNLNYKPLSSSGINYPITTQNKVIRIQQSATIEKVYNQWVTALNESINKELNAIKIASKRTRLSRSRSKNRKCNHTPDKLFSKQATVIKSRVNIRDGASMKCRIVGSLKVGNKISLLGQKRNWYYLDTGNNLAWIHKNLISIDQ